MWRSQATPPTHHYTHGVDNSAMSENDRAKDVFLVIGGSGFLGRHIVLALKARGDVVSVFDIVQRYDDVPFHAGDITNAEQLGQSLVKVSASLLQKSSWC